MSEQLFEEEEHTQKYRLYRPSYPKELFEYITNYYFNNQPTRDKIPLALDVACGSGQATVALSSFCERVIGIDVSVNQIAQAIPKENIDYQCRPAEDLTFLPANSVDLITIATALHWFNMEIFFQQVHRVLKDKTGVIAIWTYTIGILNNPRADAVYRDFHQVSLLPYWHSKGTSAIDSYQSIVQLFPYQSTLRDYSIDHPSETTIGQFLGFIQSLSACATYRKQEGEQAYQVLLETFRRQMIDCYRSSVDEDVNDIPMIVTHPLRLYLMTKE